MTTFSALPAPIPRIGEASTVATTMMAIDDVMTVISESTLTFWKRAAVWCLKWVIAPQSAGKNAPPNDSRCAKRTPSLAWGAGPLCRESS